MKKIRVLYVGDTQVNVQTSIKGIDSWTFTYYSDSARYLRTALNEAGDIECVHIPSMNCIADMPSTLEDFRQYDAVILSDLGYNNVNLQPGNTHPMRIPMGSDRVSALYEYVVQGGGFAMIGGWLSFSGIQGKGMWGGTRIEEVMPVTCVPRGADDRVEVTQGYKLEFDDPKHPMIQDLPWDEDYLFMGYNKINLRDDAHLIASWNGDVQIACRNVGKGRSYVFASDVGPHWAGSFLTWSGYNKFWQNFARCTAGSL